MSRALKIWLCVVLTALAVIIGSQALPSRRAAAQSPNPTPDPKPTPTPAAEDCAQCCGVMMPGGLTVGGPARGVLGRDERGLVRRVIFNNITRPREVCATVENTSTAQLQLWVEHPEGTFSLREIVSPGETDVLCGRANRIYVTHSGGVSEEPPAAATFRWRIDNFE